MLEKTVLNEPYLLSAGHNSSVIVVAGGGPGCDEHHNASAHF